MELGVHTDQTSSLHSLLSHEANMSTVSPLILPRFPAQSGVHHGGLALTPLRASVYSIDKSHRGNPKTPTSQLEVFHERDVCFTLNTELLSSFYFSYLFIFIYSNFVLLEFVLLLLLLTSLFINIT